LRDEKKSKDLDSKYNDYCNLPKVSLSPLPLRSSFSFADHQVGVEDFELIRVIGKGSFGKVTLVRKKTSGNLYAMKVLKKSHILKRKQIEHTKTERRVLGSMNHPFIVKLHYAFQVSASLSPHLQLTHRAVLQTNSKLFFVLDYAAGGELFFHLTRMKRFPEHIAQFYAAELASALDSLHQIV
jgi:serine/threonine protein kinase